jgi:Mn-dependent DtxR family transcriptional regulator
MSEKTKTVLEYLKSIGNENVTSADIAEALGLEKKSVDGVVTSGLQRKGLAERVVAQIAVDQEDGSTKYVDVKFIKLTEAGKAFRPGVDDVEKPADAE